MYKHLRTPSMTIQKRVYVQLKFVWISHLLEMYDHKFVTWLNTMDLNLNAEDKGL